jgi:hypothetical protein
MFREIKTSEKITEKTEKERKLDYLHTQLFNSRIGSQRWIEIQNEIDRVNAENQRFAFNPDARI